MANSTATTKVFALVPKLSSDPFFEAARSGCENAAKKLGVVCEYDAPDEPEPSLQVAIIQGLIARKVDGIAVSVLDDSLLVEAIDAAVAAGIPVVTFDSDAAGSARFTYIGTDNVAFGGALAKILQQLLPTGGRYGLISAASPNLMERVEGARAYFQEETSWIEVETSPTDCQENGSLALEQMAAYTRLQQPVNGIVVMGAWPMVIPNETRWKDFVDTHRNLTLVVADGSPVQVDLLMDRYVNGLIAQEPYQMGFESISILHQLATSNATGIIEPKIYGTAFVEMVRVPLELPDVQINTNYIGNLRYVGFTLYGLIALAAIGFGIWAWLHRKVRVVNASQPMFLIMIATGALIMGSSMIPLSFDDSSSNYTQKRGEVMCMSIPWLISIGFATTFSALFSKTWRINKIFHKKNSFSRVKVTERDVMVPFVLLVLANVIILTCWTVIAPLQYERNAHPGTDEWNRIISTYGACRSDSVVPFLVPLAFINVGLLMVANWQAYEARSIQSEFAESQYIAIVMASMLQAFLSGVPILFLIKDEPQAHYLVMVFMLFIICMAILLLIFVPKVVHARKFQKMSVQSRGAYMRKVVQLSSGGNHHSSEEEIKSEILRRRSANLSHVSKGSTEMIPSSLSNAEMENNIQQRRAVSISRLSEGTQGLRYEEAVPFTVQLGAESSAASVSADGPLSCEENEGEQPSRVEGRVEALDLMDCEEKEEEKRPGGEETDS